MGLRERLRRRTRHALMGAVERIIGSGPWDGPTTSARTSAWPPERMGAANGVPSPAPHPADLAAAGRLEEAVPVEAPEPETPTAADAPFDAAFGQDWDREPEDVDTVPIRVAVAAPADDGFPSGSIAQAPWLPMPKPAEVEAAEAAEAAGPTTDEPTADEAATPAAADTVAALSEPLAEGEVEAIQARVIEAMKTIYDPEIPVDIYELGLIYDVEISPGRDVEISMTLTSPNCPAAQSLPGEVEVKAAAVEGVRSALVDIVWDPPWGPERMSEAARLELNIDYM